MINLDTCKSVTDTWEPVTEWCDMEWVALTSLRSYFQNGVFFWNDTLLEQGSHFGKMQYRYSVRKI